MKYKKNFKIIAITSLLFFICILVGKCYSQKNTSYSLNNDDLDDWVGEYIFVESFFEPDYAPMIMDYKINIYKENDKCFADIEIEGQTTAAKLKAQVFGDNQWISLVFIKYLPDNIVGLSSNPNSVLISFRKEGSDIYTYWGGMQPMLYENERDGKVYFSKCDNSALKWN